MPDRSAALTVLLAAAAAAGCGPSGEGFRAYGEGRYAEARAAFGAREAEEGEGTPPEVLHGLALACLRTGGLAAAEAAADRAAARGGARFEGLRDFVRGSVAFARCDAAVAEADAGAGPAIDGPTALDQAAVLAAAALESWSRAAASRPDWPEARRNAERAALRLRDLEARREARRRDRIRPPGAPPPLPGPEAGPLPPPPAPPRVRPPRPDPPAPPERGDPAGVAPPAAAPAAELPPDGILRLLERLASLEREKAALRSARREERGGTGGKDW